MTWLVWRRVRVSLAVALGLVVLVAVVAVVARIAWTGAAEARGVVPCLREVQTGVCDTDVWYSFLNGFGGFYAVFTIALIALPGVTGAVVGAALFGGELARGTHVLALSQSVSRLRWFGHGLLVAGLPVALALALLAPVADWWANPFGNVLYGSVLGPDQFLVTGLVPAVYGVLAFSVAAAAGLLLRSPTGALGLALAVQVGVLILTTVVLRSTYLPPERLVTPLTVSGGWAGDTAESDLYVGGGYVDAQGRAVGYTDVDHVSCGGDNEEEYVACMADAGIVGYYTDYQPSSRYWPFQAIESGLLLALAAAALGAGLWGLRRRVH